MIKQIIDATLFFLCRFPWYWKIILVIIWPFVTFIVPLNQIIYWIVFASVWFSKSKFSKKGLDMATERHFGTAFGWSILFYWITMMVVYGIALPLGCKYSDS